jgi:PadR family transcriptional regulator PadR
MSLQEGSSYGLELLERLREAGLRSIGDASVYGVLKRLEGDGSLAAELRPSSSGPARKYYSLTVRGTQALDEAVKEWDVIVATLSTLANGTSTAKGGAE